MTDTMIQPWMIKENWGDGEWVSELDQYRFLYKGYDCIIVRNELGCLCGYVRIPKNSPFMETSLREGLQVHGNISHAETDEFDDFWIGFDCAQYDDLVPAHEYITKTYGDDPYDIKKKFGDPLRINKTYKNVNFVENELMNLVDQIFKKRKITKPMKRKGSK